MFSFLHIENKIFFCLSILHPDLFKILPIFIELNKFINTKEEDQPIKSIEILEKTLQRLLNERETLGAVNLRAEDEMNEMLNKIDVMSKERVDLEEAIAKLRSGIFELNKEGRQRLKESFEEVNENFSNRLSRIYWLSLIHI